MQAGLAFAEYLSAEVSLCCLMGGLLSCSAAKARWGRTEEHRHRISCVCFGKFPQVANLSFFPTKLPQLFSFLEENGVKLFA